MPSITRLVGPMGLIMIAPQPGALKGINRPTKSFERRKIHHSQIHRQHTNAYKQTHLATTLFSSTKLLTVALSIVSCAAAYPTTLERRLPSGQVIAWRVASGEQAARWKKAGTVTPDKNEHGTQIGEGQYTSPGIGQWMGKANKEFCVIMAKGDAWKKVDKAWIPEKDGSRNILWDKTVNIDQYIKHTLKLKDPAKVARMPLISGAPDQLQTVIPHALTNCKGGGLDLRIECHPDEKAFNGNTPEVDYYAWKQVHGDPQCTS